MLDRFQTIQRLPDHSAYFDDLYETVRSIMLSEGFVAPNFQVLRGNELLILMAADIINSPEGKDMAAALIEKVAMDPTVSIIAQISEAWMTQIRVETGEATRSEIIQVVIHRRGKTPVGHMGTVLRNSGGEVVGVHDFDDVSIGESVGRFGNLFGGTHG